MLLQAAFLPPQRALRAWEEVRGAVDLERLDAGSQRLVPQLYASLRAAGAGDPLLENLRVPYRKTWVKNRVLFRELRAVLAAFEAAQIETLLLKGAALIPLAYRDYGRRPMGDLDVLVRPERAAAAIDVLQRSGWRSGLDLPKTQIGMRHADGFVNPAGCRLDLHWSVLQECCRPGDNDDFWHASVPLEVEGVPTRALCPADQLLHLCVHGARSSDVQPLSWVADAMIVLSACGDGIDWSRLLEQTRKRRLTVPKRNALAYLAHLDATIPPDVLRQLETARASRLERLEWSVKGSRRQLVGSLPVLWFDYWRVAEDRAFSRRLLGFPAYLQLTFRVRTLWRLPLSMLVLAARRIRSVLRVEHRLG